MRFTSPTRSFSDPKEAETKIEEEDLRQILSRFKAALSLTESGWILVGRLTDRTGWCVVRSDRKTESKPSMNNYLRELYILVEMLYRFLTVTIYSGEAQEQRNSRVKRRGNM